MKKCRVTNALAAMAAALLMTGVCSCQQGDTERKNTMEPWQIQLEQSGSDGWLHFAYGFGVAPESANLTLVFDEVTQRFNLIQFRLCMVIAERKRFTHIN